MRSVIDKVGLLDALRSQIAADLAALERRQKDTQEGATHEESRSEHAKDTRATELGYLARGLAERVAGLRRTATALAALELRSFTAGEPIAVTALVVLDSGSSDGSTRETWFIVPGAGGIDIEQAGLRIRTLTPVSPLGRSLLGLSEGDEGSVQMPRGKRDFEVIEVR